MWAYIYKHTADATGHAEGAAQSLSTLSSCCAADPSYLTGICAVLKYAEKYKTIVQVPSDPHTQLQMAIKAVFSSWYTPRAKR
jgi:hypothetical protein